MLSIQQLIEIFNSKNYKLYEQPFKLNILFIRSSREISNKFDDVVYWFWKDSNKKWNIKFAKCTTKSGLYYIKNPLSELGTATLKTGQYIDSHKIGLHKNKYTALVQTKTLPVWRDNDKDTWIDYKEFETGIFGINIHRANAKLESTLVDDYSAACQVFANPQSFKSFINQCQIQRDNDYNYFTITLIDKKDLK